MRVWIIVSAACLLTVPLAAAGDAAAPDVVDPANDQSGYNPSNAGCNPNFGQTGREASDWADIDILTAWFQETGDMLEMGLTTSADIGSGTYLFAFSVGEENYAPSHSNGAYNGPEGGSSAATSTMLVVLVPKASVGLSEGGTAADWSITASRPDEDRVPGVCGDNWAYRDFTDAMTFTLASAATDLLASAEPASMEVNGTLEVVLTLFNNATQDETVTINASADPLSVTYGQNLTIPANSTSNVTFLLDAGNVAPGGYVLNVTFAGNDGVNQTIEVPIDVTVAGSGDVVEGTTDGNATQDLDDTLDDAESPGAFAVLAVVAAVALARRR